MIDTKLRVRVWHAWGQFVGFDISVIRIGLSACTCMYDRRSTLVSAYQGDVWMPYIRHLHGVHTPISNLEQEKGRKVGLRSGHAMSLVEFAALKIT